MFQISTFADRTHLSCSMDGESHILIENVHPSGSIVKDAIIYHSEAMLEKMTNHLWYLAEELMATAFYDSAVSVDEKKKMVENLNRPPLKYVSKNKRSILRILRKVSQHCRNRSCMRRRI